MQLNCYKVIISEGKEKTGNGSLFLRHMYTLIRAVLFAFDPEWVHHFSMNCLKFFCKIPYGKKLLANAFVPKTSKLTTLFLGMTFSNPVGLAAGFDKNARYLNELEALGFGFVEIGTVTPLAQPGNEKPRLFRLPKDHALINRMGFNNEGVEAARKRLEAWRAGSAAVKSLSGAGIFDADNAGANNGKPPLIIGGNIGKNKTTPNENAWQDYVFCFKALHPYVDYFVVNVSSPNTPGLRELQEKESLRKILTELQTENKLFEVEKPVLLKIAPDLTDHQVDEVIGLAMEINLDGLVVANTTISREHLQSAATVLDTIGAGGLSGAPLKRRNSQLLDYIVQKTNGKIPLIASGGIFDGEDAEEKLSAGAGLIQVWTGFVYKGPAIVKNICKTLATPRL